MAKKPKMRRQRGVVLTPSGLQRLQQARQEIETAENSSDPLTLEQMSERTQLDMHTVRRALSGSERVDRSTLEQFFTAFGLALEATDFDKPTCPSRQDWGKATFNDRFLGRQEELETLDRWIGPDRCRTIAIYGAAGIGKTSLALEVARQWQNRFEVAIWRSLRDPVAPELLLQDWLAFLAPDDSYDPEATFAELLALLIAHLQHQRCLLVLDNVESLFQKHERAGEYRPEWAAYGELFEQIGATDHKSCLLLTTQVKPREIAASEGDNCPTRSLLLRGIQVDEVREMLAERGLKAAPEECVLLMEQYSGNPLLLSMTFATIRDVFGGDVTDFVTEKFSVFGDISDLLAAQFKQLSPVERDALIWLVVLREPVSFARLRQNSLQPPAALVEALESLFSRAIAERRDNRFFCQPIVQEYVTGILLADLCHEIVTGDLRYLQTHALYMARASQPIRDAQARILLEPLLQQLLTQLQSRSQVAATLAKRLEALQDPAGVLSGYAAGNLVNLLRRFGVVFPNWNFSGLALWQADFDGLTLQGCDFRRTDLRATRFTQYLGGISDVAFSPDGLLFASGDTNGDIHVFQAGDGSLQTRMSQDDWLQNVTFAADGSLMATGGEGGDIELWEMPSGDNVGVLRGHSAGILALQFSPQARLVASGSDDGTLRLWDPESERCLQILHEGKEPVKTLCFSPDGQILAGSDGITVRFWQMPTGECSGSPLQCSEGGLIQAIAYNPKNCCLAAGSDEGGIWYWDLAEAPQLLHKLTGHQREITSLSISPDGLMLASGSEDGTIRLWQLETGTCIKVVRGHQMGVAAVDFAANGRSLVSGSFDRTIRLWNRSGDLTHSLSGRGGGIWGLAFNPAGNLLAASRQDNADLWDIAAGSHQNALPAERTRLTAIDFSPDGQHVVGGAFDGKLRVWEAASGKRLESLQGQRERTLALAFSPNGQWLASSNEDSTISFWNWQRRQHSNSSAWESRVWSLDFAPDSQRLACASHDGAVRVLEAATGDCLWNGTDHLKHAWSAAFSADSCFLASGSHDGTIKIWEAATGRCLRTIEVGQYVFSVTFSPDGKLLASGRSDGKIDIWDTADWRRQKTLEGHQSGVWALEFSPNNVLASTDGNETISLWDLSQGDRLQIFQSPRPYEGMNVAGARGLAPAQLENLRALGAISASDLN